MLSEIYHIEKVYYWNGEEVAVTFDVVSSRGDVLDRFDSYTKAERKICKILERDNSQGKNL